MQINFENTLKKIQECRELNNWSFRQIERQNEVKVQSQWTLAMQSAIEMSVDYRQGIIEYPKYRASMEVKFCKNVCK
jgi:hypothetical protein